MGRIFISWSGDYGRTIARAALKVINSAIPGIKVELVSPDDRGGKDWRQNLETILNNADIGILILTPEAQQSWWMPWELGMLHAAPVVSDHDGRVNSARDRDTEVYHLVFELGLPDDLGPLKENYFPFSKENFESIIMALASANKVDPEALRAQLDSDEFQRKVFSPFEKVVKEVTPSLRRMSKRLSQFKDVQKRVQKISDEQPLLDEKWEEKFLKNFKMLVDIARDDLRAFNEVSGLIHEVDVCVKRAIDTEGGSWVQLDNELANEAVFNATKSVEKIARGQVGVPAGVDNRKFYIRRILGNVQESMWTINIGNYEGSFGRENHADILNAHRQVKKRNPNSALTRVFVVNMEAGNSAGGIYQQLVEEHKSLSETMKAQQQAGVRIRAITKRAFEEIVLDWHEQFQEIGSTDFNILDGVRVYTTKVVFAGGHGRESVELITLLSSRAAIKAAEDIMGAVEEKSFEIRDGDLSPLK